MPQGDEVYVTIAQAIPYVNYVATAYKVVDGMLNFGRESEIDKAIRLLTERVGALEQFVRELDDRLSEVEVRVAQAENRARLRTIKDVHQLSLIQLARHHEGHPEDAAATASNALDRLRSMVQDDDLWLWSDVLKKPDDAPGSWRPAPPQFKGMPLQAFAVGTMLWAVAAQAAIAAGADRGSYIAAANELLGWIATRPDWIPYQTPPVSIAERFRAAINIEIVISTKYVTREGYCEYAFVGVNDIERTRTSVRNANVYFGPSPNTLCTADPRIADGDEALLEDEAPQLKILQTIEDAVTRIRDRGHLTDPFIGQFPNWTAHRLTLFGIEPGGDLRRFQFDTTTALVEPPQVAAIGDVVGTGWQNFDQVLGTYDTVLYAFSHNGAVDWYREDDVARGPSGWSGPRRVRQERSFPLLGEEHSHVNGSSGTFYVVRQFSDRFRIRQSLELMAHRDPANGGGAFVDGGVVVADWWDYPAVFGGGEGTLYGIDAAGDLFWHKHSSWPNAGTQFEGPIRIGNGWNSFSRVFSLGHGFIAGVYPNGSMMLYHFQQWRWGPRGQAAVWHGPVKVPGTQWRGFKTLIPMIGNAPAVIP